LYVHAIQVICPTFFFIFTTITMLCYFCALLLIDLTVLPCATELCAHEIYFFHLMGLMKLSSIYFLKKINMNVYSTVASIIFFPFCLIYCVVLKLWHRCLQKSNRGCPVMCCWAATLTNVLLFLEYGVNMELWT
jgi:hypothetical protein